MKLILIIFLFILPFTTNAEKILKCNDSYDKYKTSQCLKEIKRKLINTPIIVTLYDLNNNLYTNKYIYMNICNKNLVQYTKTDEEGKVKILLTTSDTKNCSLKININIKTGFGKCKKGKPSRANWNSLDLNNNIKLKCN